MADPDDKVVDPFVTEELEDRRAKQRQTLRLVSGWLVERVAGGTVFPFSTLAAADRGLVEVEFRGLADKELDGIDQGLLERMGRGEIAEAIGPVLSEYDGSQEGRRSEFRPEVLELREAYFAEKKQAEQAAGPAELVPDGYEGVVRLVMYLLWADELASDYRDRRVRVRHGG